MKRQKVSSAVIRRLPRYYRHLIDLQQSGMERISSNALGKIMNLTASQIRQDLSCFGEFGQQGYGYNVKSLQQEIAEILGMKQGNTAVLIGAGNLGRALIENFQFDRSGFRLLAAFDVDAALVGKTLAGIPVYHVDEMAGYLQENKADVGVLTVPRTVAANTAERLALSGVKGLWNFTNVELTVSDPRVVIEDVHFADSLLALSYMIGDEG